MTSPKKFQMDRNPI